MRDVKRWLGSWLPTSLPGGTDLRRSSWLSVTTTRNRTSGASAASSVNALTFRTKWAVQDEIRRSVYYSRARAAIQFLLAWSCTMAMVLRKSVRTTSSSRSSKSSGSAARRTSRTWRTKMASSTLTRSRVRLRDRVLLSSLRAPRPKPLNLLRLCSSSTHTSAHRPSS